MKVTVRRPTDIEITRVRCYLPYDEEDFGEQDLANFPVREGTDKKGIITLEIDLDNSRVVGWPEGKHFSLLLKVRDEGTYGIVKADGEGLSAWQTYVPGWLPGSGDYFIADIQGDGAIFQDGEPWEADADEIAAWLDGRLDEEEEY